MKIGDILKEPSYMNRILYVIAVGENRKIAVELAAPAREHLGGKPIAHARDMGGVSAKPVNLHREQVVGWQR